MRSWPRIARCKARAGQQGQAMVEFALFLPILLVLLFGVVEIGMMISDQIALVHAAHDGARAGSAPGCNLDTNCEIAAAVAQANAALSGINQCATTNASAQVLGSNPQQIVVTVQCTYQAFTPLGGLLSMIGGAFNQQLTLSASTNMRVEQ
jgi:Flp pilus assembly protein TadG